MRRAPRSFSFANATAEGAPREIWATVEVALGINQLAVPYALVMSEAEAELSLTRQRRALRRSTITWTVLLVLQAFMAAYYWISLIFESNDGYRWVGAIAFSIAAGCALILVLTTRRAVRRLEDRQSADPGAED